MAYPIEHLDVPTNGIRLHVAQCGPDDGPLVLLLHGFPEFWYGWRRQMQALAAAGYRVWAPDQRGYNLSDKPRGIRAYALPTLAADVLGLLDAAGGPVAGVVGHDWGGIVAWYLAQRHPEALNRVAILNAPPPGAARQVVRQRPKQLLRSWYVFFFQLPWLPERWFKGRNWRVGEQTLRGTSRRGTFAAEELRRYRVAWAQPRALTSMINWYRALRYSGRQRRASAGQITLPVRIIWGEKDVFLEPRFAQLALAQCQQGELFTLPKATHWLHHEEPDRVNELLLEFLVA